MNSSEIANVILSQLGGNRFIAMTGACNLGHGVNSKGESYLSFKFKGSKKFNYCAISLNGNDLYDMQFIKMVKFDRRMVKDCPDNYNNEINHVFETMTGLLTRL